ncbi:MAG: pyridoxine 5'-phosphate synthase [Candidatus Hydrogenedentota bacterium]|nr:MAG: pyridoxine 5'-phosphate synthase [Candidatus Hydrogenedentota bacterium]
MIRLGVNIDHIATLRNARGENDPILEEMLFEVIEGGADQITLHLREDRRHIRDLDAEYVITNSPIPVNLEMALTQEMTDFASKHPPTSVCLVPEKREELTTEGGLDLTKLSEKQRQMIEALLQHDIEIYPFVEASINQIEAAKRLGVHGVEIHTGPYAHAFTNAKQREIEIRKIEEVEHFCKENKLGFHAGHGLNRFNLPLLVKRVNVEEVNIGHSIIARALKIGLRRAVYEIKCLLKP